MSETVKFSLNPRLLNAAAMCTAQSSDRSGPMAVLIEPAASGAWIVGTDGHIIGIFHDAQGNAPRAANIQFQRGKLRKELLKKPRLTFNLGAKEPADDPDFRPKRLIVSSSLSDIARDGCFETLEKPIDWRKAVLSKLTESQSAPRKQLCFDPDLMDRIVHSAKRSFGTAGSMMITQHQVGKRASPLVVSWSLLHCGFYIMMPLLADERPALPFSAEDLGIATPEQSPEVTEKEVEHV